MINKKTREGNDIAPAGCDLRLAMPEKSICKNCIHVMDICKNLEKKVHNIDYRTVIYRCRGFEILECLKNT